ncbi:MAG: ABC transporter substrate-binding protein [Anaerolineales bacterium]
MHTPRLLSQMVPSQFQGLQKGIPRLLVSILIAAWLWGCAESEPTPTPEPVIVDSGPTPAPTPDLQPTSEMTGSVSLWLTWKPEGVRALNELIESFQSRHPGFSFAISYVPADELRTALDEAQASGTLPALILAPSTWAGELFESGLTQDLSDQPTDEFRMLVHPLPWAQANDQGQVLGIPVRMLGNVLYRNRELAPIPAGTLEGLVEADQALRGTFNEGVAQDYGFIIAAPFAAACGGQLMQDGSAPDLENPVVRCWLELLRDLAPAGPVVFNSDEDRALFEGGQAGWLIESTENFDQLSEALGEGVLTIDPWPVYQETGESLAGYVWTENAYFASNLKPEDFEAAWEFVGFLLSEDSQLALSNPNGAGHIPVHISAPALPGHVGQMLSALLEGTALPTVGPRPEYVEVLERAARAVSVLGTPVDLALQRAIAELAKVPDV